MARIETGGDDHQDHRQRVRLTRVQLPGAPEEAEDRDRKRRAVRPSEEDRRAELAERDREREAGRDAERPAGDGKVDLAAHSSRGRAEHRGRLALALVDRAQRGRDDADDERDRDERLHDGTIHGEERKSIGSVSKAMTKPKPSITADAPSGSMRDPSSSRVPPPREPATANAARPPTTSAIDGRTGGVDDGVQHCLPGRREERVRRPSERTVRLQAVAVSDSERALDEDGERNAEEDRQRAETRRRRMPSRPACRSRRNTSRSERRCPPSASLRSRRVATQTARATQTSCTSARTAAARRSNIRRPGCRSPSRGSSTGGRRG